METVRDRSADGKANIIWSEGRIWFSRDAERRFYFILTILMLILGIFYKTGLL